MTAISVSERLLEMAAFYTPLALTVTFLCLLCRLEAGDLWVPPEFPHGMMPGSKV